MRVDETIRPRRALKMIGAGRGKGELNRSFALFDRPPPFLNAYRTILLKEGAAFRPLVLPH